MTFLYFGDAMQVGIIDLVGPLPITSIYLYIFITFLLVFLVPAFMTVAFCVRSVRK